MSQVAHPYGYRLVTLRDWKSRWFASNPRDYREFLRGDIMLREYLTKRLQGMYVSDIQFERNQKLMRIILESTRPGVIIGRNGEGIKKVKADIEKFIRKNKIVRPKELKIDILEIQNAEANAMAVAQNIEEALRKRLPFRRVLKQALEKTMQVKEVKGCRIVVSGLIGGSATMARREQVKQGPVPLQFIRADIDYAALPVIGSGIGIKVWINKGDSLKTENA